MGCGCGKGGSNPLPVSRVAGAPARVAKRVAVYEVVKSGDVVLSTGSPTQARSEARRLGATVRVSSRPVDTSVPEPAGV